MIDEQVIEEIAQEAPLVEEQEVPAAPQSIRESLADALAKSKENNDQEKPEVKADRTRKEDGKFAKEPKAPRDTKPIASAVPPASEPQPVKMPKSFKPELQAEWSKLPRPMQESVAKREEDFHKELTKHDEERVFGRSLREMATPYLPIIRAEGGDITKAFSEFLNTAYQLRTATPQAKGQLFMQLAQKFGADMRGASQAPAQTDPVLQQIIANQQRIEREIAQGKELKKQQEDQSIQDQIKTFSEDPKNTHFEAVKADMAALLKGGVAKDLQDAYERAVYANPHTRSTILQQQVLSEEQKRVADKKAKAEQAKKAGSSIKGAPGMAASKNGTIVQKDLRSELKAAFASHSEG